MQNSTLCKKEIIESIVHTYGDCLYRICYLIVGNKSDAEDIVQDTVIKYIEKMPDFKDEDHKKAWLITVAKNKCKDLVRYKRRHMQLGIDEIKEVSENEHDSNILELIMSLPEKFSLVLVLYYVEEYKVNEIAKIIEKTASCVKMRLQKGRKLLSERYRKEVICDDV